MLTCIPARSISPGKEKESFSEVRVREADVEVVKRLHEASREDGESIYDKLARSIAPEIYGMRDVKKALVKGGRESGHVMAARASLRLSL